MKTASPLRYPGGKTCLYNFMSRILFDNGLRRKRYAEPFAGGCGLALNLLYNGHVSDIHINDVDSSIWAFWHSTLFYTNDLIHKIKSTPITIDEWHNQKAIHKKMDESNPVDLGFATFFLNRTNRSGVIKDGGPIGGYKQIGNYKLDCRFNKNDLEQRIERVAKYRSRIHLSKHDAMDFMKKITNELPSTTFFCIDPPYYNKGKGLYTSFYNPEDHKLLANYILSLDNPWIVTYDKVDEISNLYKSHPQYEFDINYSVQIKRVATELLISSKNIVMPQEIKSRAFVYTHLHAA